MSSTAIGVYSRSQFRLAVWISAFLGWAPLGLYYPIIFVSRAVTSDGPFNLWMSANWLLTTALFGLPIAALAAWAILAPLLRRAMRREINYLKAAFLGALTSSTVVFVSILVGRLNGLALYFNDNRGSRIGLGEYTRSIDGILTTYGWMLLARDSFLIIAACSILGLLVRWLVGKPTLQALGTLDE